MGDFVGHPFRGNQWGDGGQVGESNHATMSQGDYRTSGPDGSAPTPDDDPTGSFTPAAWRILRETEAEISSQTYETAQVLAREGHSLLVKDGGGSFVAFSTEEAEKMNGGVLTHNHPNSGPLSDNDIALTMSKGLREMRAICRDGTLYRLGIKTVAPKGYTPWSLGMQTAYHALLNDYKRTRSATSRPEGGGRMSVGMMIALVNERNGGS